MFGLPFRQLPQRKRRLLAFGVIVCWLMLNTQLALAAHLCDVPSIVQTTQVAGHHGMNMTQTSHHASAMVKAPLCDKHCTPDNAQKTASPLHLDAMAHDTSTLLVLANDTSIPDQHTWLTPPRTGPPAEIVYCRFRE